MNGTRDLVNLFLLTAAMIVGFILSGCDNKEMLLDVETDSSSVEVQRDRATGNISIDVDE